MRPTHSLLSRQIIQVSITAPGETTSTSRGPRPPRPRPPQTWATCPPPPSPLAPRWGAWTPTTPTTNTNTTTTHTPGTKTSRATLTLCPPPPPTTTGRTRRAPSPPDPGPCAAAPETCAAPPGRRSRFCRSARTDTRTSSPSRPPRSARGPSGSRRTGDGDSNRAGEGGPMDRSNGRALITKDKNEKKANPIIYLLNVNECVHVCLKDASFIFFILSS